MSVTTPDFPAWVPPTTLQLVPSASLLFAGVICVPVVVEMIPDAGYLRQTRHFLPAFAFPEQARQVQDELRLRLPDVGAVEGWAERRTGKVDLGYHRKVF